MVCYQGINRDLHDFIPSAISNDSPVIIAEKDSENLRSAKNWVIVKDAREAWAYAMAFLTGSPEKSLCISGITGTNGKSSTVFILGELFKARSIKRLTIGTLGFDFDGETFESAHTTPDPDVLFPLLAEAKHKNIKNVFMEVSSHAICQKKVSPLEFSFYGFTSFSQDHLDFHKDMDEYFMVKVLPIETSMRKDSLIAIHKSVEIQNPNYFKNIKADIIGGENYAYTIEKNLVKLKINKKILTFQTPYIGSYANENLLMALSCANHISKIDLEEFTKNLDSIQQIPGRLEIVSKNPVVIVDYAHTPDALYSVLKTIRNEFEKAEITCVFGCGGDRDKKKRPLMAKESEKFSQKVILTNDNPRTENPDKVLNDIKEGFSPSYLKSNVEIEANRERAIESSIIRAGKNSVILIAGKGHEDYQIIGTEKLYFDDRVSAKKALGIT